jgi:hypothetical protein
MSSRPASGAGIRSCLPIALLAEVFRDLAPLPVLSEEATDAAQDDPRGLHPLVGAAGRLSTTCRPIAAPRSSTDPTLARGRRLDLGPQARVALRPQVETMATAELRLG